MRTWIAAALLASAMAVPAYAQDHHDGNQQPPQQGDGGQHHGGQNGGRGDGGQHNGGQPRAAQPSGGQPGGGQFNGGARQAWSRGGGSVQAQAQPQAQVQTDRGADRGRRDFGQREQGGMASPEVRDNAAVQNGDRSDHRVGGDPRQNGWRPQGGAQNWQGQQGRPGYNGQQGYDPRRGDRNDNPGFARQGQDRGRPGGNDGRFDNRGGNRGGGNWNRGWRQDNRYNWQSYRTQHRDLYRVGRYRAPYGAGYGYRRFSIGYQIDPVFYAQDYWISDPAYYRLPPAYGPYRWVRYYNDALLVDLEDGEVVDSIPDFFY